MGNLSTHHKKSPRAVLEVGRCLRWTTDGEGEVIGTGYWRESLNWRRMIIDKQKTGHIKAYAIGQSLTIRFPKG